MLFEGIRGTDILLTLVDVLIVAYIIYRLLLVLKGTRAMQILVGLAFVLIGYGIAKFMGLLAVSWLFDHLFASILIVVVVIFQQDIRKALSRIGRQPFSTMVTSADEVKMIEEIVKSVIRFAELRTGALIVIEREANLTDIVEGSTPIDAQVSADLLLTIFNTHTPLHDGAIIVQSGRITHAAVLLPLSSNPRLARELGTRHRAAIGISEETDAIVVVVSEETGKISLCMGGRITRDLDGETLRKVLLNLLGGTADKKADKKAKKAQAKKDEAQAKTETKGE